MSHAVELVEMCLDSRLLLVASAAGQVTLFRFVKTEGCQEIAVVVLPQLSSAAGVMGGVVVENDQVGEEQAELQLQQASRLKPHRASSSPSPSRELRRQAHMAHTG